MYTLLLSPWREEGSGDDSRQPFKPVPRIGAAGELPTRNTGTGRSFNFAGKTDNLVCYSHEIEIIHCQLTTWQQLRVVGMQPTVQCVGKNWKPEGNTAKKHAMPRVHGGSGLMNAYIHVSCDVMQ